MSENEGPSNAGSEVDGPSDAGDKKEVLKELSGNIDYNVSKICSNKKTLENTFLRKIGTANDNADLRKRISTIQQQTNKYASETTKYINGFREASKNDKHFTSQAKMLEDHFIEVIKQYHELQKKISEQEEKHPVICIDTENVFPAENDENHDLRRQSLVMLESELQKKREIAKNQMLEDLGRDILDVNRIFQDIGKMVTQDGEVIDKIAENTENALTDVEGGQKILEEVEQTVNNRRKCYALVIIIISVLVIGILCLILYFQFK